MTKAAGLAFSIDRSRNTPVFEQICAGVRAQIMSAVLAEGARLPPTRGFATDLGVSRSTVVTAYEQLVAEGYLHSVQGSGYTVCALGTVELAADPVPVVDRENASPPAPRPFQSGQPDMRLFPHRQWAQAVSRLCRADPQALLMGAGPTGHFALRRAIAAHVAEWRGITASPHQIIITAGSSDALEICTRTLADRGDRIGLEDPGYPPMRHFAQAQGLEVEGLPVDDQGASLPRHTDTRLAVLTPSHQFPLGGAMSPARRLEFIRWAEGCDGWIIEDDYDSEFRYAGRPIPAMAGFDHLSRTIYVGSFSKIFSNSLRLGYVILPAPLVDPVRATVDRFGARASVMAQRPLADFIDSGEFYRHLRRVRRIYGDRRRLLLDRLAADFAPLGHVTDHQAGMQVVFHLKDWISDRTIAKTAGQAGLLIQPLSGFASQARGLNGLILGYCAFTADELDAALDQLLALLVGQS